MDRINFLEKRPFAFNYRMVLLVAGGTLGLLLFFYGIQMVRIHFAESRVATLTAQLNELKAQQEMKLSSLQKEARGSSSAQAKIRTFLEEGPSWSKTLEKMVASMPHDLWLTDVKSYDKDTKLSKKSMIFNGHSLTAESVAQFMKQLLDSGYFHNVFLSSSALEDNGGNKAYAFSIDTEVLSGKEGL